MNQGINQKDNAVRLFLSPVFEGHDELGGGRVIKRRRMRSGEQCREMILSRRETRPSVTKCVGVKYSLITPSAL